MAHDPYLKGADDPELEAGDDAQCWACPMIVGTRGGFLNRHAMEGYAPPNGWCEASKQPVQKADKLSATPRKAS